MVDSETRRGVGHNSKLTIEIPEEVGVDPDDVVQWVGEEFNWMFMPLELWVKPAKED